jgi:transcriptional regulator with XRE-family HTH domain
MIGERLEEARKRKGVSIREVAEATKIRGDYLLAMEDNSFEIPLPQIYIRGFLKNYARFLKLDPNKLLTDYDAHLLGRTSRPARSSQDSLGHVEIPGDENQEGYAGEGDDQSVVITEAPEDDGPEPELTFSLDREEQAASPPPVRKLKSESSIMEQDSWNENKTLYMKIGLVFMAILLISITLIVMVRLLGGGSDSPDINPELVATPSTSSPAVVPEPAGLVETGSSVDSITISASDNLTLIVEQTRDRKRLYSGTLNAGETLSLEKEGPVSIRFSNGSALVVEVNGQRFTPPQSGVGRTVVD